MACLQVELGRLLLIERAGIAAAFDEGDARLHRISGQRLQSENDRAFDKPMDQQPVSRRIDIGDAGVVALEVEAVRRDRAIEPLQRRSRCAGARRARRTRKRPEDLRFKPRGLPVTDKRRAWLGHPWLDRKLRGAERRASSKYRRAAQGSRGEHGPPIQKPVSRGEFRPTRRSPSAHFAPPPKICRAASR